MIEITKLFKLPRTVIDLFEDLNPECTFQIYDTDSQTVLLDGNIKDYWAGKYDEDKEESKCSLDDCEIKEIKIGIQIDVLIGI